MNSRSIQLVQDSFQKVLPIADQAMVIFYEQLFTLNPSLKRLFPANEAKMGNQRNKLKNMLAAAVAGLSNLPKLVPILQNLGKRHATYGVEDTHYEEVGAALLATLQIGLGADFTPEVKQAWLEVYGVMATTMMEAAEEKRLAVFVRE